MYENLIIPKRINQYRLEDIKNQVQKYADSPEVTLTLRNNSIIVQKGRNYIRIDYHKSPIVLEESQEFAKKYQIAIEEIDERFEMYGDDPDDVLYNTFLLTQEHYAYNNKDFYVINMYKGSLEGD